MIGYNFPIPALALTDAATPDTALAARMRPAPTAASCVRAPVFLAALRVPEPLSDWINHTRASNDRGAGRLGTGGHVEDGVRLRGRGGGHRDGYIAEDISLDKRPGIRLNVKGMPCHILEVVVDGVEDVRSAVVTGPVVRGATWEMMQVIARKCVVILRADEQKSPVMLVVAGRRPGGSTIELAVRDSDVACGLPARYDHLATDEAELAVVDPDLVRVLYGERVAAPDVLRVDIVDVDILNYDIWGTVKVQAAALDDTLAANADWWTCCCWRLVGWHLPCLKGIY